MNDDQVPAEEIKARMLSGELYRSVGEEIAHDQARAQDLLERYNATRHSELELRSRLLRELLGDVGDDVIVLLRLRLAHHDGRWDVRQLRLRHARRRADDDRPQRGARQCCRRLPRVTIADDTVVGAGAVVTHDLPAGVVALGVPARVVREVGDADRIDFPTT